MVDTKVPLKNDGGYQKTFDIAFALWFTSRLLWGDAMQVWAFIKLIVNDA